MALYILGDEGAVSNEASPYLYKITSGNEALMPLHCLLVPCLLYAVLLLGKQGDNLALSSLGQQKQQVEQDDNRYVFQSHVKF